MTREALGFIAAAPCDELTRINNIGWSGLHRDPTLSRPAHSRKAHDGW